MSRRSFRGRSQAPWLHIELFDRDGNLLYRKLNALLVEVTNCGGYELHVHRLPTEDWSSQVYDLRVWMGGTAGERCR